MKQLSFSLFLVFFLSLHDTAWAGGWGPVYAIEVRGDAFSKPLVITEPSIVEELSFWVGPGTGYSEFMGPVNHDLSIVDWERGEVADNPDGLASYEIRFLLEPRDNSPKYTIVYEPDPEGDSGYIYYPTMTNSIVTHFVDGTWRYASTRWNDRVGAAIAAHLQSHPVQ
jgi:hypothetical protein